MAKTTSQNIKLGLLVISGLFLLVFALYIIGSKQSFFGSTIKITTSFNNVSGLIIGNSVRYSGIDAGIVSSIKIENDSTIRIEMSIKNTIAKNIKKNAVATVGTDGLVGNTIINISPKSGNERAIENGDSINSLSSAGAVEMLAKLNATNENISLVSEDLLKITQKILTGNGLIGTLINDTQIPTDIKTTLSLLQETSKNAANSTAKLNQILSSLGNKNNVLGVIQDTSVANKLKSIVNNFKGTSKDVEAVVANLNATILNVKNGKGLVNYLSNDPSLVRKVDGVLVNVDSTVIQLNESSRLLNQNLEALKHNIFFRGYFRKLEKEKQK